MNSGLRLLAGGLLLLSVIPAHALTPEQVFERLSPSVVLFTDPEGGGSGIVLNSQGLILTNYHVVNTPLPVKVTAKVKESNGKVTVKVFENVKVSKVHPTYDLALVQIEADGAMFAPAPLLPANRPLQTGTSCMAIGHPWGGEAGLLEHSITRGLVSSASRTIEGQKYIQIDAAINPGNSGGAVCNDQGQVFGVATFKVEDTEGIAFAIPTQGLQMTDFVDKAARPGDLKKAFEYQEIGNTYFNRARLMSNPEDRDLLMVISLFFHRMALTESTQDASLYQNVGILHDQLGNPEIARPFYEEAIKVNPNYAPSNYQLGWREWEAGNLEAAEAFFKAGLGDKNDNHLSERSFCAHFMGMIHAKRGDSVGAYYFVCWANMLETPTGQTAIQRLEIERAAKPQLTPKQASYLASGTAAFSLSDLGLFAKDSPSQPVATTGMPAPTPGTTTPPTGGGSAYEVVTKVSQSFTDLKRSLEYPLNPPSGTELTLEDGPEGMTLENNKLIWSYPIMNSGEEVKVLYSVQAANGSYQYVSHTITLP